MLGTATLILLSSCAVPDRTLHGGRLALKTEGLLWATQQILRERGGSLYRLVPADETDRKLHRFVMASKERFLVVEKDPIAIGKYASGAVTFTLPENFEPSTHCFVLTARGHVIGTRSLGSDDKRLLIGLRPYSKQVRQAQQFEPDGSKGAMAQEYARQKLECEGRLEDFLNRDPQLMSVGTP